MRRWTAVVVVLVLASAACGDDGGGGAGGSADVAAPPVAASPSPPRCHAQPAARTADALDGTVDCAAPHQAETVHSGEFTGAAAAAESAPAGRALNAVYTECDEQAATALGADWRAGRLRLDVVVPAPSVWSAGQRWFRCDLVELTGVGPDGKIAQREGTLAGALAAPDAPLRLGCALVKLDRKANVATLADSPCDVKHEGEFAGVWTAPAKVAYPVKDRDYVPFYEGCLKTIAAYAKVPYQPGFQSRTGYVPVLADKATWEIGDRGVRCFLWIRFRPLTASQEGVGEKGFPANIGRPS